ncbi:nucleic acid-binding protein [Xylariaceae sp. FL0804]|nr:nucleic acid-binding protein [Xylariaceae sp. FL0804]
MPSSLLARPARLATSASASASASFARRAFTASARRDIARITLVGNLAATPELKATATGRELVEYAVASNDRGGRTPDGQRNTSWFRVASFEQPGPRRDYLTSLPKGTTVFVEGNVSTSVYTDGENKTRSTINIYQDRIEVLRRPAPLQDESAE